ncbi:MAG: hypothetical protein ABEL76_08580, partial [Bradymonadaceae bacterium]
VVASGAMKLPDLTFDQVHRVDTEVVTQPAAGKSTARRQVSFLAECAGEVARATSPTLEDGTPPKNFERASEVRRLAIPRQ